MTTYKVIGLNYVQLNAKDGHQQRNQPVGPKRRCAACNLLSDQKLAEILCSVSLECPPPPPQFAVSCDALKLYPHGGLREPRHDRPSPVYSPQTRPELRSDKASKRCKHRYN
ncbi:hypothetical protein J6590_087571 [Homalodisca vitripennis]|nr:hypothetical protein J6590_102641 [Homalodisca vitripennis]KAG8260838.1 hypothetical protein J6590_087571 [Homalodisca vitripennis]